VIFENYGETPSHASPSNKKVKKITKNYKTVAYLQQITGFYCIYRLKKGPNQDFGGLFCPFSMQNWQVIRK